MLRVPPSCVAWLLAVSALAPMQAATAADDDLAARGLAALTTGFTGNAGQRDARSQHRWRHEALTVDFAADGFALSLRGEDAAGHALHLRFEDAAGAPLVAAALDAVGPLPGRVHVYSGQGEHLDVPRHAALRYRDLLPGLDLLVREADGPGGRVLEYDLLAAPGVDPAGLVLRVLGGGALELRADGTLVVPTSVGDLSQAIPAAWQVDADGGRTPLAARFVRLDDERFGLAADDRDGSRPLVIDPQMTYASYLGGGNIDYVTDVAVGADGRLYMTGLTGSPGFPVTPGAWDGSAQGISDAFVASLDVATGTLGYVTFFGGTDTSVL